MGKRHRRRVRLNEAAATLELLRSDLVEIDEAAIRADGTVPIKVISPGWGTSGYYPEDVLQRDAANAFPAGTQMFWDHPTLSEAGERPERSLRDLAGILDTPARWVADHPAGPGVYADAKVFSTYQPVLAEMAPHIGVSIRASGEQHIGEAEGRRGRIIDRIIEGRSVDFVTKAGRGGQVLALLESAREQALGEASLYSDDIRDRLRDQLMARFGEGQDRWTYVRDFNDEDVVFELYGDAVDNPGTYQIAYTTDTDGNVALADGEPTEVKVTTTYTPVVASTTTVSESEEDTMDPKLLEETVARAVDEKLQPLQEANTKLQADLTEEKAKRERLEVASLMREARDHVAGKLTDVVGLPAIAATKIIEAATANPPTTDDGTLDTVKLDETVKADLELWSKDLGLGQVTGLGEAAGGAGPTLEEANTALEDMFRGFGLSDAAAKTAVAGRR